MAAKREGAGAEPVTVKPTPAGAPLQVEASNVQFPGVTSPPRLPWVMAWPPTKEGTTKVAYHLPSVATGTSIHWLG